MSPLGNPSGQQLGRGSHLSTCRDLGATGSGAAGPDPSPAHVGPGCRTQSSTLTPKARFFHGHSKSPDLEHQKETFPVWHRALRAQGIYSSASSARAASPSAAASAAEPLPRAGQEEQGHSKGGGTPSAKPALHPGSAPAQHEHSLTRRERQQILERQELESTREAADLARQG